MGGLKTEGHVVGGLKSPFARVLRVGETTDVGALTPVDRLGKFAVKRDDLLVCGKARGGKIRACFALAAASGLGTSKGLVGCGLRTSPQLVVIAEVAKVLGVPCVLHTAAGNTTPEIRAARAAGADIVAHRPGYLTVILRRAKTDVQRRRWVNIPFGMASKTMVETTARQTANIPDDIKRVVVPCGSGMSLAGIVTGLREAKRALPVLAVCAGGNPSRRLDLFAPADWRSQVTLVDASRAVSDKRDLFGLYVDPVYEALCLPHLRAGDLLWLVGLRPAYPPVVHEQRTVDGNPPGFVLSVDGVVVRPAAEADVREVLKLRGPHAGVTVSPLPAVVYYDSAKRGTLLCAYSDDKVVGFALLKVRKRKNELEIWSIVTADDAPKGAGRLLCSEALNMTRRKGMHRLLVTNKTFNDRAQVFYRMFGFRVVSHDEHRWFYEILVAPDLLRGR